MIQSVIRAALAGGLAVVLAGCASQPPPVPGLWRQIERPAPVLLEPPPSLVIREGDDVRDALMRCAVTYNATRTRLQELQLYTRTVTGGTAPAPASPRAVAAR